MLNLPLRAAAIMGREVAEPTESAAERSSSPRRSGLVVRCFIAAHPLALGESSRADTLRDARSARS
jgi:hypothetical protein